jgi:ring-1,2-phenylacetyl-CoA epoxidase subunit PaaE
MTPEGRFFTPLDPKHSKALRRVRAGSGITPVLSLIRTVLRTRTGSRFTLIYGNRRQASVMFHEALEDLKDRYLTRFALFNVFSREAQDIDLFNGRIDGPKVRAFLDTLIPVDTIDEAFVCGPAIDDRRSGGRADRRRGAARARAHRAFRRAGRCRRPSRSTTPRRRRRASR